MGGTEDDTSQLVLRLLIKLLKGCSRTFTNNISSQNYNTYLRRLFLSKREEAEEDGLKNACEFECKALLDDNIDFAGKCTFLYCKELDIINIITTDLSDI